VYLVKFRHGRSVQVLSTVDRRRSLVDYIDRPLIQRDAHETVTARPPSSSVVNDDRRLFIALGVHLYRLREVRDVGRRAGLSAAAETCDYL